MMNGNMIGELQIPKLENGVPVEAIERKAFLSKKNLRRVTVPACVKQVGDWAFAYCDNLHTVLFEGCPVFGKSVFLDCKRLKYVYVGGCQEWVAALLAAAVTTADAPYLLDAGEAGSKEWVRKWDARMQVILQSPDTEGYSKQVLCGEEDYGSTDMAAYQNGRRRRKVRLALLRLIYTQGLDSDVKARLEAYLREHTKGCETEEAWQVILEEHGDDKDYYQLFADLGCITADNFDGMLADVGEDRPELKAWLMRYKTEQLGYEDFFGDLDL